MFQLIATAALLAAAVALCLLCGLGQLLMRDPLGRLQFSAPIASLALPLIVVAIWTADPDWQSRIKATLIGLVLFFTSSVLSHATARAARIRDAGSWPPPPDRPSPKPPDAHDSTRKGS